MKRLLATIAGLLLVPCAWSQSKEVLRTDGSVLMLEDGRLMPMPATPGVTEPEEQAEQPSELQQLLTQLTYDRRPSVILKAWSPPPPERPEPPQEPQPAEEAQAPADEEPKASDETEATEEAAEVSEGDPLPEETPATTDDEQEAGEENAAAPEEELTAEQAREAEEAARKQAYEALVRQWVLEILQRNVTLGRWDAVQSYFAELSESEAEAGYRQMLKSLRAGPPQQGGQFAAWNEKNAFAPEDVVGLAAVYPREPEAEDLVLLGQILAQCVASGNLVENCVELLHGAQDAALFPFPPAETARIVIEAGFPIEAGEFLPAPNAAREADDRVALNLLARHFVALYEKEGETPALEEAWSCTQAVLALGEVDEKQAEEALKRAVSIAPRIREELGQVWLDESFTDRPERGMEILSAIGASASLGLVAQAQDADARFGGLELQTTAANALLSVAPERAEEWARTLNLLAANWLREAEHAYKYSTSAQFGPVYRRDPYGNIYYVNQSYTSRNRNLPQPIPPEKMLDARPSDAWLAIVVDGLRPRFSIVLAQLLLKAQREQEAFPFIETLASTHPERAEELVEEFLRVWADNHNPNAQAARTASHMFMYGFEQRANAIPLTRSKQERNLAELAEWVKRLRALPLEDLDESLIAHAFTSAHSAAEVYRVETIEGVFGSLGDLGPTTLAELVQRMRANLVSVWRRPSVQKDNQTRRRQKDIENEILRGYEVARAVVDQGIAAHPDHWGLALARASVDHDENNFRQEVERFSEFSAVREEAFASFQHVAELYHDQVEEADEEDATAEVYETWFYASLGACDLAAIDAQKLQVTSQLPMIQAALESLPEEVCERHRGMFANSLFTRISSVNPAVKFRYIRSGLEVVGDHERSAESREILEYYEDLVTEIQLEARIDGDDRVGHDAPFGIHVDLRHTREIEREAGGFSKYLVNQNDQRFAYNYGRPTEDYRDKFEEAAVEALQEHFDVLSVTFNHPDTHSRADDEYGWRITPYAYILVQARGPEVDRVPALRFDLDFLDTSGYVVLPVESSAIPIDSADASEPSYSAAGLAVTQTLDERQAQEGRLVLEVRAEGRGLIPELERILDLAPEGFVLVDVEDQGVLIREFDQEGDEVAILSERTWMISMHAEEGLAELPQTFTFGTPRFEETEATYQRYVDADLASVASVVDLEASYGTRDRSGLLAWTGGFLGLAALAALAVWLWRGRRRRTGPTHAFTMPEDVSAFTVIGLLRRIEAEDGLSDPERDELRSSLESLEATYFRAEEPEKVDLEGIAERWIQRTR